MPPKRPMSASPLAKRIKTTKTTKSATPLSAQVASRRIKEEKGVVLEASTAKKSPLTRTPTVKRQHLSINDGSPSSPSPSSSSWRSVYDLINEWRLEHPAPVDTMGCERIAETDKGDKVTILSHTHTHILSWFLNRLLIFFFS